MEMRADAELTGRRMGRTDGNWNGAGIMVVAGSGPSTTHAHHDVNEDLGPDGTAVDRSTYFQWGVEPGTIQQL